MKSLAQIPYIQVKSRNLVKSSKTHATLGHSSNMEAMKISSPPMDSKYFRSPVAKKNEKVTASSQNMSVVYDRFSRRSVPKLKLKLREKLREH